MNGEWDNSNYWNLRHSMSADITTEHVTDSVGKKFQITKLKCVILQLITAVAIQQLTNSY